MVPCHYHTIFLAALFMQPPEELSVIKVQFFMNCVLHVHASLLCSQAVRPLQAELEQLTEEEDLSADEVLLLRMDAGLYTLQQCALIIGNLWIVGDQGVKQRLLMLLHQQVHSWPFLMPLFCMRLFSPMQNQIQVIEGTHQRSGIVVLAMTQMSSL